MSGQPLAAPTGEGTAVPSEAPEPEVPSADGVKAAPPQASSRASDDYSGGTGSTRKGLLQFKQKGPVRAVHHVHPQKWDKRHPLFLDKTNEPLAHNPTVHPSLRRGFSQPHSAADLEKYLSNVGRSPSARSLLVALRTPEAKRPMPATSATAVDGINARAPMCPERSGLGGSMSDRDKIQRPWNDRFVTSGSLANEFMHKSHRSYFGYTSGFEVSASQLWRRSLEQEVSPSVWWTMETRRPARFPPPGI